MASDACDALGFDRFVFIPNASQPLKTDILTSASTTEASAQHRLAMTRLAVIGDPRFDVDPIEVDRGGVSYSVDTVESLCERNPTAEHVFLLGVDAARTFGQWKNPRRICELVQVAVVTRSDVHSDAADADFATLDHIRRAVGDDVPAPVVVKTRRVDVSSTEVRARVRAARSIRAFVPDAVARYIGDHGLYRPVSGT